MGILRDGDAASESEAKLALLLAASEHLGTSLDPDITLASLATLLVPRMADGYVLDVVEKGTIRRLAAVDHDPAKAPLMEKLKHLGALNPNAPHGIQRLLEAGKAHLHERMTDEGLAAGARDEEHLAILRAIAPYSGIIVPMKARGRSIGLLWLYYSASRRTYGREDLAVAEDLASRAALAIENARLFQELAQAVRARDDFLAIASHELRTPVTALMLRAQSFARTLTRNPDRAPTREQILEWLGLFNGQITRMSRLIEEMLDVSRMSAGRLRLYPETADLAALVREAAVQVEETARRTACALTIDAEDGIVGSWDKTRIEQVVVNLLSNAMKYGEGQPVELRVARDGERGVITVRDHGIGIDPAHVGRIFDRFERVVSSRNYGGLGLGLWIAKQIVDSSGGAIRVESAPGAGSTFIVELPVAATE